MLNSIRFEFYNNFDIWYDLYQENGGDPNRIINIMTFANSNNGEGHGSSGGFGNGGEREEGNGHWYESEYEYINAYGIDNYFGSGKYYDFFISHTCISGYGTLYANGNGYF